MINTSLDNVRFYDAMGEEFDGYTDGTRWNGWLNVWLDAHEWPRLLAAWEAHANEDDQEYLADLRKQEPEPDGLYSIAYGYCTDDDEEFNPYTLAHAFVNQLRGMLTPEQLQEVARLNATPEYSEACATHNYCDANVAMIAALAQWDIEYSENHNATINAAWNHARVLLARRYGDNAP